MTFFARFRILQYRKGPDPQHWPRSHVTDTPQWHLCLYSARTWRICSRWVAPLPDPCPALTRPRLSGKSRAPGSCSPAVSVANLFMITCPVLQWIFIIPYWAPMHINVVFFSSSEPHLLAVDVKEKKTTAMFPPFCPLVHIQNIREGVNFINFASEFESVYFDRSCQNKGF